MDRNNKHTQNSRGREGRLYVVEISEKPPVPARKKAACTHLKKIGEGV
jgi:hypothetical protein